MTTFWGTGLLEVNGSVTPIILALGFLIGDLNGSGKVTGADIAAMKARINPMVTSSNYKVDFNVNGAITGTDVRIVKGRAGRRCPRLERANNR